MSLLLVPPFFGALGGGGGAPPDVTAPTLTFPVALPLGDTSGYIAVMTDEANGTLYYVITTSVSLPSAAQVKAGQDHTGAAAAFAGSQAIASTGNKTATATGLASNTTYYAYFMHEDAAANQSAVKALTTFTTLTTGTSDTDFDNLIAAASVAPADLRKGYVARFIGALYAGSLWGKIDAMWVLAAHDEQFGRLNWKDPGNFTLSAVNSPTFTTDRGFAGDGSTSYLATGWDWGTNGSAYTLNNCHMSIYQRTSGGTNGLQLGNGTGGGPRSGVSGRAVNTTAAGRANAGSQLGRVGNLTVPNQMIARRTDSANHSVLRNGASHNSGAATSTTTGSTGDFNFGVGNLTTDFSNAQIAGGSVGGYFDDTEALAFYNAWRDFMVALGADT